MHLLELLVYGFGAGRGGGGGWVAMVVGVVVRG